MTSKTFRAGLAIALMIAPLAFLAAACSRAPEQQFLTQFFRAARARDTNTVAMMSAVVVFGRAIRHQAHAARRREHAERVTLRLQHVRDLPEHRHGDGIEKRRGGA